MSRTYDMSVVVHDVPSDLLDAVENALNDEWSFDDMREDSWSVNAADRLPDTSTKDTFYTIYCSGVDQMTLGTSEDDFAESINRSVLEAVGHYIPISVAMTCLDHDGEDQTVYREFMIGG